MSTPPPKTIWPVIHYDDAPAAIEFLQKAFGFTATIVVADETNPAVIQHSQLRWPEGGGVMVSSADRRDGTPGFRPTGSSRAYIVTDHPDAVHDRALAAGATLLLPLTDEDYGSRGFSVTDPEGNIWDFGTYAGQG
ncbi:MAG: VOC family protein [Actinomycetota bacterium]